MAEVLRTLRTLGTIMKISNPQQGRMDGMEEDMLKRGGDPVIVYLTEFFCESHLQDERFISDKQAVDHFGSLFIHYFWSEVFFVNSFIPLTR